MTICFPLPRAATSRSAANAHRTVYPRRCRAPRPPRRDSTDWLRLHVCFRRRFSSGTRVLFAGGFAIFRPFAAVGSCQPMPPTMPPTARWRCAWLLRPGPSPTRSPVECPAPEKSSRRPGSRKSGSPETATTRPSPGAACPPPSSSPNVTSGGNNATATITPINVADTPVVNASAPAQPDANATAMSPSPTACATPLRAMPGPRASARR